MPKKDEPRNNVLPVILGAERLLKRSLIELAKYTHNATLCDDIRAGLRRLDDVLEELQPKKRPPKNGTIH